MNAYALVVAGLLPGCGTLGDRVGHKRMFVAGLAVFGMASLARRLFAHARGADRWPRPARGRRGDDDARHPVHHSHWPSSTRKSAQWPSACGARWRRAGAVVGPLIGGVLLEYFWWGSVFLINVPVAVAALLAALVVIPHSEGRRDVGWDLAGSLLILVGLVGLAFAIKEIAMAGASWPVAVSAAVIGALALFWFARRQRGSAAPLIDLSLFENRGFRVAVLAALVSAFSVIGLSLVLSQRLQLVLGFSPLHAALVLLPSSVLAFIGGPLSGWLTPRYGANGVMAAALLLAGLGEAGLFMAANVGLIPQLLCLALFGLGAGASLAAASDAIMSYAPPERAGMAASIEEVSIELGGAIGITVLGSILASIYSAILVLPSGALPSKAREGIDQALGWRRSPCRPTPRVC